MSRMWKFSLRCALGFSLLLALFLLAGLGMAHAAPAEDGIVYVVRPGDRLGDIAARYGVTTSAIVRANGLTNPDRIYAGQRLIIPGQASSGGSSGSGGGSSAGGVYYTVKLGDSLGKIAKAYGINATTLARANGITNPDLIWVGQRLYIPGAARPSSASPTPASTRAAPSASATPAPATPAPTPKPATSAPTVYIVQAGDTLSAIAKRYGTTVEALVAVNGLGSADMIRVGMRLVIPRAGDTATTYPGRPTSFVVSISQQRCWLYRGNTIIAKWICSTGRSGSGTRTGTFRIQSKMPKAYGSTWNIWMPFWLGIYWAGGSENGIHGLPWNAKTGVQVWTGYVGTPITYGCVMLDNVNAKMLYDSAYIGMPVIIKP